MGRFVRLRCEVQQGEDQHSPGQAVEEVERRCPEAHREEEQFSLVQGWSVVGIATDEPN